MTTAEELIEAGRLRLLNHVERFSRRNDEYAQALELLEHAAGRELDDSDEIDTRTRLVFQRLIERRATGEPVGYIRGYEDFLGLRLAVKPGAFIPRETTQFLAQQAVRRIRHRKSPVAADLATGVGSVALVMTRDVPHAAIYGSDISRTAIRLARSNARSNGLPNARFLVGSMFDPLPSRLRGTLDLIVSHPPYVASHELSELPAELIEFEPVESLTDSSHDGFGLLRVLVLGARQWLKPGGWLCLEIAPDLVRSLRSDLIRAGYRDVRSTRRPPLDTRVVVAKR